MSLNCHLLCGLCNKLTHFVSTNSWFHLFALQSVVGIYIIKGKEKRKW